MQEIPINGTSFLDQDAQSYPGKLREACLHQNGYIFGEFQKGEGGWGVIPDLKKFIASLVQMKTEKFGHKIPEKNAI